MSGLSPRRGCAKVALEEVTMSKDRDGSVRARGLPNRGGFEARYKYNGSWWRVMRDGCVMSYSTVADAKEAAYAMYNVACSGGVHQ